MSQSPPPHIRFPTSETTPTTTKALVVISTLSTNLDICLVRLTRPPPSLSKSLC
eukprot:m.267320 g.267320  ORF g.267320 m.267320 type:complete len:54 (+) comp16246_c1_seq28:738-899(+)